MADLEKRSNPSGFEGSTRPVPANPQEEMSGTNVRQLIKPDQMSYEESTGKADVKPGADEYGSPSKG
jgi:hypothetical protein